MNAARLTKHFVVLFQVVGFSYCLIVLLYTGVFFRPFVNV
jgi:hypothetical protein